MSTVLCGHTFCLSVQAIPKHDGVKTTSTNQLAIQIDFLQAPLLSLSYQAHADVHNNNNVLLVSACICTQSAVIPTVVATLQFTLQQILTNHPPIFDVKYLQVKKISKIVCKLVMILHNILHTNFGCNALPTPMMSVFDNSLGVVPG